MLAQEFTYIEKKFKKKNQTKPKHIEDHPTKFNAS